MGLYERVAEYIEIHGLLPAGARVVLGVSGGPDSICLLDCLHHLGYDLIIAHLDHQLRAESGEDAEFVRRAAVQYGYPFFTRKEDLQKSVGRGSLEEVARKVRYRFLIETALQNHASYVATGHTADDQVETILMHLLRGAGSMGLRGMLPSTDMEDMFGWEGGTGIRLVRPLLFLTTSEVEAHCEAIGLKPRVDASNFDRTFFRNKIRHELLPVLREYNPAIRDILVQTGEVLRAEVDFIQAGVSDAWEAVVKDQGYLAARISTEELFHLDLAVQRALIRRLMHHLQPGLRDINFRTVERIIRFARDVKRPGQISLAGGLTAISCGEDILLLGEGSELEAVEFPQIDVGEQMDLPASGVLELGRGWKISIDTRPVSSSEGEWWREDAGGSKAVIDYASLEFPLRIRSRKDGDKFRPLGLGGTQKLSDFFINLGIPRVFRDRWPLVISGEDIVWVSRLRISHTHRITPDTREAVVLQIYRDGG